MNDEAKVVMNNEANNDVQHDGGARENDI